jgi:chromate transporter
MTGVLLKLALLFGGLSLLAVGSANSVVPDMQRAAVGLNHWMTDRDFLDLFALSRVAPGPGSLIVALIGQNVAGLAGAAVAVLAMFGPTCVLVHFAASVWHRFRDAPWRARVERGMAPLAIGLIFASAIGLIRGTQHSPAAIGLTAAATVVLAVSEIHPLIILGAGAAAGYFLGL